MLKIKKINCKKNIFENCFKVQKVNFVCFTGLVFLEKGRKKIKTKSFNNEHELGQELKESIKKSSESIHDATNCFKYRVYEIETNQGGLIIKNKFLT